MISPSRAVWWLCGSLWLTGFGWAQSGPDLDTLRTLAAQGDSEAQNALGNAYTNGQMGVKPDLAEALKWYQQAGEKGYAPAQFNLGLACELGRGREADEREAFKYYLKAAEQGYAPAQFNVGNMYSAGRGIGQDFFEANLWFKQAADNGIVEAQFNLGLAYESGRGLKKDEAQAARWYRQAADHGYARAQYNLGLLLEDGRGVTKDMTGAVALYRAAAEQGLVPAQVNYGLALAEGRPGLPRDPEQALVWLNRAVENGAKPDARDALLKSLSAQQVAAATKVSGGVPAPKTAPVQTAADNPAPKLIEQLREQSRRLSAQVETLTAEKEAMDRQTSILQAQIRDLQQDKAAPPSVAVKVAAEPVKSSGPEATQQASIITTLQRDNIRLNDEVKRSTRELLSLNQQLRALRSQPAKPAATGPDEATTAQVALLTAKAQQAAEQTGRLETENQRLVARVSELEKAPKPAAADPGAPQLAEARQVNEQLKQQLKSLQGEKSELEKWSASLEKTINEKAAATAQLDATVAELREKLVQREQQLASASSRKVDTSAVDGLKRQLAEANQALEKNTVTVAELTAANSQLEKNLATANRGSADLGPLRSQLEQLTRDNARLTSDLSNSRSDGGKHQARVGELEKQLADALTVRTRGGDDSQKLQTELTEANRSVDKLNATVAELTVANEKLEKDLDSAQKSTAAALAAQSEAVSAASPDAFKMEISTLNSRIKQLEAQVEEERAGAAREVSTLAAQMQRLRETNKSLTDANRALLSAKANDTAATQDDIEQLQAKVRDLTATGEELRRAGQKQAADLRSLTAERDSLQTQLADARKVATVLPGLADEKTALQERLEAVGGQLVQLQRDHEDLQKIHADLTEQLTASKQSTEKAQADLAALQGKAAEAEKAVESHTASVAELTQTNSKLELQHEDMRRLVESYRSDITRLTQAVRAAEQQKTEAERSGQQNIDTVTAQLGQMRRELEAGRSAQSRLAESFAAQDRDRAAIITQLRTENSALAARLNQAQSTLDQIASAARLGTPAATIASGGLAPTRPAVTPAATEVRYHTVTEGDSLSRISMRYYGTANRWQDIFQANRDTLQGSSALRVGMQLRIP